MYEYQFLSSRSTVGKVSMTFVEFEQAKPKDLRSQWLAREWAKHQLLNLLTIPHNFMEVYGRLILMALYRTYRKTIVQMDFLFGRNAQSVFNDQRKEPATFLLSDVSDVGEDELIDCLIDVLVVVIGILTKVGMQWSSNPQKNMPNPHALIPS